MISTAHLTARRADEIAKYKRLPDDQQKDEDK
jgi:DNA-directed RNA polymerase subunit K/omega